MSYSLLSQEEESELGRRAHAGDEEARNALVLHNQRFLIKIVTSFARKHPTAYLNDLLSEGNYGLIHAAELFDPDKGFRFTTYAINWIMQAMRKYVGEQSDAIRIPQYQIEHLRKIRLAKAAGVDDADLSEATGVSQEDIYLLMPYLNPTLSLDAPVVDDGEGTTFCDLLSDGDDFAETSLAQNLVSTMLSSLPEKYRDILIKRYGLYGSKPMTLAELAVEYGVTRERIRQLELKALRMCRRCA